MLPVERTSTQAKLTNANDALTYWDEAPDTATIDELVEKVIAGGYAESDNDSRTRRMSMTTKSFTALVANFLASRGVPSGRAR